MHGKPMNAMPDFRLLVRNVFRFQATIDRLPSGSAIVGSEGTGGRDGHEDSFGVARV